MKVVKADVILSRPPLLIKILVTALNAVLCFQIAHYEGRLRGFEDDEKRCQRELRSDLYRSADEKHRQQVIAMKVQPKILSLFHERVDSG